MFDVVSWINLIKESIKRKNFNPWEIDLVKIADAYLETIKTYKKFDIKLSADVILVGGILLKLKSKSLYYESLIDKEAKEDSSSNVDSSDSSLSSKSKVKKEPLVNFGRKTSLNNLIKIIKRELSKGKKKTRKKFKKLLTSSNLDDILNELLEDDKDIEKKLNFIYNLLLKEKFFEFSDYFKENKLKYFLPLIIAANEGKCELSQKVYFGELYVKSKLGDK